VRDQPIAIYGRGARGSGLSLELTGWSRDLVLCTDGPADIDRAERHRLERNRIAIREDRIVRLEGRDRLERIIFDRGDPLPRSAVFFTTGQTQQSHLALSLGCELNEKGTVRTGPYESTHLSGLYVAGDASRAVQWVIVAAAEGAEAAFAMNSALLKEDLL
jgi:thioredoxin reductase